MAVLSRPGLRPAEATSKEELPVSSEDSAEATFAGSLSKGLRILSAFDADHTELSAKDIADLTDINRGSVYRILRTLESLGFVARNPVDSSLYSPTVRVFELGFAAVQNLPIFHAILPRLERLLGEFPDATAVSYGELDGPQMVYVIRLQRKEIIAINLHVGSRLPAQLSSIGKSVMAAMEPGELDRFLESIDVDVRTRFTPATIEDLRASIVKARRNRSRHQRPGAHRRAALGGGPDPPGRPGARRHQHRPAGDAGDARGAQGAVRPAAAARRRGDL